MPEEKKKESFTFSDKIKNSKPANSKSFAKRSSSKIGSDGKPRQTLFERTKRDAPFFIAALVALLLLPFLYKYSGNAEEEPTLVTPGYEDSAFNPERSGFDGFAVDPEGQIAQLTGRDPLELIGLGRKATEEVNEDEDFLERSAYSGEGSSASHSLDEQDEEENTTNIYQYRKKAPAATRAAFRRAATPINRLPGAQRAGASGSRLGVGMWGGSIKPAANKVKGSSPQSAPKPVSLQPLQAAGKPTKAYFGQPNSQLARKSKDAMSKGNAMQALMDSNFKPVEPGKFGGVIGGDFGGPGGGKGDMKREFNYNAKEPWWWDMMKQRSQAEWKAKFDLKWKAINKLADIGLHWLEGILNCLFTGNDDGDMDTFLGSGGGAGGKAPTCCGVKAKDWNEEKYGPFGEESCNKLKKSANFDESIKCKTGKWWDAGHGGGSARVGFFAQRAKCFGAVVGGYTSGDLGLNEGAGVPCDDLPHYYRVNPSGEARKWNIYTYVVARNYVPMGVREVFEKLNPTAPRGYLCTEADDHYEIGKKASAGVSETTLPETYEKTGTVNKNSNTYKSRDRYSKEQNLLADMYERKPEDLRNGCVIYQVKSDTFNYKNFETEMVDRFEKLLKEKGGVKDEEAAAKAREAFLQLDLMFVESVATKDKLGYAAWGRTGHQVEDLPMVYHRFEDIFIRHKKSTASATGSRTNVDNRKYRVPNVDMVQGDRCYFKQDIALSCEDLVNDETGNPVAHVVFKKSYKGGAPINAAEEAKNLVVTAQYTAAAYAASNQKVGRAGMVQMLKGPSVSSDGQTLTYTFKNILDEMGQQARRFTASEPTTTTETSDDGNGGTATTTRAESSESFGFVGKVTWTVKRKSDEDGAVLKAECAVNMSGDNATIIVQNKRCNNKDDSEDCCKEHHPKDWGTEYGKDYIYINGECIQLKIPVPECKDMHTSKHCCELMHDPNWGNRYGTDYTYNEQTKKCEPIRVPSEKPFVHFAPIISWVPNGLECRRPKDKPEERLTKSHFPLSSCTSRYVPPAEQDENTPTHQHCGLQEQIVMDSKAAYDFVMQVADKYNEQPEVKEGKRNPISRILENNYPTDGEFIDALQMAKTLGIKQVPASAVCELGRDMVRMSRDPHAGHLKVRDASPAGTDFKNLPLYYRNELGAFLVYVHKTSILYPGAGYRGDLNNPDCRFLAPGVDPRACPGVKMGKAYHFNNYNSSRIGATLEKYLRSFDDAQAEGRSEKQQIPQTFPLAELTGGRDIPHNCGGGTDCDATREKYPKVFGGMFMDTDTQNEGKACTNFAGNSMMSVEKALEYVTDVCKVGLDAKPYGQSTKKYYQGQRSTAKKRPGKRNVTTPTQSNSSKPNSR